MKPLSPWKLWIHVLHEVIKKKLLKKKALWTPQEKKNGAKKCDYT